MDLCRWLRCCRCNGEGSVPDDAEEAFTDEHRRQMARLPHHAQAEVQAFPGGQRARELAANVLTSLQARGVDVAGL
jgi:hypothetical protein